MDVDIDAARVCHIIHTSNIGRHNVLGAVGKLIIGFDNTRVKDIDRDVIGVVR